jgi:hypothetical protein
MFKKIILLEDYVASMDFGIVSVSFKGILTDSSMEDNTQFSFYTRNPEFISHVTGDDVEEVVAELEDLDTVSNISSTDIVYVGVFDILKREYVETSFSDITGEVLSVASLTKPDSELTLVDARIYFGNRSGAMSITENFLSLLEGQKINMLEAGFKDDEVATVFDTVLAVNESTPSRSGEVQLKSIHLVKPTADPETDSE